MADSRRRGRRAPGACAAKRHVDLSADQPPPVSLHPLRGVATADPNRAISSTKVSRPSSSLVGERPFRTDLHAHGLALVNQLVAPCNGARIGVEELLICVTTGDENAESSADFDVV